MKWNIDQNIQLQKQVTPVSNSHGRGFKLFFYKADTLYKVTALTKTSNGTQLTSYYFDKGKPIYISLERNNYKLTDNVDDINKAVGSFDHSGDTLVNQKSLYIEQYQASYYFYRDKVRFAAVVLFSDSGIVKKVRHDDKDDISQGMELFEEGKRCTRMKP